MSDKRPAPGRLIGVGMGPGDPELVTVKACRILAEADLIAYPAANDGPSRVRRIADPYISDKKAEISFPLPMRGAREPAQASYDTAAASLEAHLVQDKTIAVLCEGDPLFYGSFMYLANRLAPRFPTEVVPGITSVSAACAAALYPLVARTQALTILPATLGEAALRARLQAAQSAAVLKLGRHIGSVKAIARDLGAEALYIENATEADARLLPLEDAPEPAPYFSLALIRTERDPWLT